MTRLAATLAVLVSAAVSGAAAQSANVVLEYRVKAAYLFNFTRFVEWPEAATPLTICVAGRNPFGNVLADTLHDEQVNGREMQARVVRQIAGCDVLFVPRGVAHRQYLREARDRAVLTVGESPQFLRDGGIINFVIDEGKVRFEIDRDAATRARLTISSRLLRLARGSASANGPSEKDAR